MGNLSGFDANTVGEQKSFDAIPADKYVCIAVASGWEPTQAGDGKFLKFEFEVIEGPYKGRKVWDRLNLDNKNQQAVDIAQRALGALCRAVGIPKPQDSSELHNRPVLLKVGVEPGKKGEQNVVQRYESASPGAAAQAGAGAATTTTTAAAAPAARPWERRS